MKLLNLHFEFIFKYFSDSLGLSLVIVEVDQLSFLHQHLRFSNTLTIFALN
jgi:hypothetical protein